MSLIHPQHDKDLSVLQGLPTDSNRERAFAELARLLIRYQDFPGAEDIQLSIQQLLQEWQLTPEELFQKTRSIHQTHPVFRGDSLRHDDWA
jgi:Protein of unknown function (DUF3288)